jgi:hypothetical protein
MRVKFVSKLAQIYCNKFFEAITSLFNKQLQWSAAKWWSNLTILSTKTHSLNIKRCALKVFSKQYNSSSLLS